MRVGLAAFRVCEEVLGRGNVFEVFPTVSYIQTQSMGGLPPLLCEWNQLCKYPRNAKDVLDATAAAYTVALRDEGLASCVPGGDGLGEILVPGRICLEDGLRGVLEWPG
jgi:hypothetical protein